MLRLIPKPSRWGLNPSLHTTKSGETVTERFNVQVHDQKGFLKGLHIFWSCKIRYLCFNTLQNVLFRMSVFTLSALIPQGFEAMLSVTFSVSSFFL